MCDIFIPRQGRPLTDRYQVIIPEHAPGNPGDLPCAGDHLPDPLADIRPARVGWRDGQGERSSIGSAGAATEHLLDRRTGEGMGRRMIHEQKDTRRIIILSLLLAVPASPIREIRLELHGQSEAGHVQYQREGGLTLTMTHAKSDRFTDYGDLRRGVYDAKIRVRRQVAFDRIRQTNQRG